ncbi:MAG: Ig-like domain-containing protein, partial [Lachnospiraceae bacterium]|nr:Ig-like domain-containing protein [Lachnospiraceae bacterium]
GEFSYICKVSVGVEALQLNVDKQYMYIGAEFGLYVENNSGKATWTTSDSSVVSLSGGTVTALKYGKATVTATIGKDTGSCEIYVVDPKLSMDSVVLAKVGDSTTVSLTGIHDDTNVTFGLEKSGVATISSNGASCTITATQNGSNNLIVWWYEDQFSIPITVGASAYKLVGPSSVYAGSTMHYELSGVPASDKANVQIYAEEQGGSYELIRIDSDGYGTLTGQFDDQDVYVTIYAKYNGQIYTMKTLVPSYNNNPLVDESNLLEWSNPFNPWAEINVTETVDE